jgi:hypothetical protein
LLSKTPKTLIFNTSKNWENGLLPTSNVNETAKNMGKNRYDFKANRSFINAINKESKSN